MASHTFTLGEVGIHACPNWGDTYNGDIKHEIWEQLAHKIAAEPGLGQASAQILENRWRSGFSVILLNDGEIIGYQSLLEWVSPAILDGITFPEKIQGHLFRNFSIIESCTGFIDCKYRRRGLSFLLRKAIYEQFQNTKNILFGISAHLGAQTIWSSLGWQEVPFQCSIFLRSMLVTKESQDEPVWKLNSEVIDKDTNLSKSIRCYTNNSKALTRIEGAFFGVDVVHIQAFLELIKSRRRAIFGDLGWTVIIDPWAQQGMQ
jgi:hypothetical protein